MRPISKKRKRQLNKIVFHNPNTTYMEDVIEGLYNKEIKYRELETHSVYRKLGRFFNNVHPVLRTLGYRLMLRDRSIFQKNENDHFPAAAKVHLLRTVSFCYTVQCQKWLKKTINPNWGFRKIMLHLFVKDGVEMPNYLLEHTFLEDEQALKLFIEVGKGGDINHWIEQFPMQFTEEELTHFLNISKPLTIWEGTNYASLRSMGVQSKVKARKMAIVLQDLKVANSQLRKSILRFFVNHFEQHTWTFKKMIKDLKRLLNYKEHWIRDLATFSITEDKKTYFEIFQDLLSHLFVKYPLPSLTFQLLRLTDSTHFSWFLHLAKGLNIRTAKGLPFKMNRKEAHYFWYAPKDSNLNKAYWYAKIRAMGGTDELAIVLSNGLLREQITEEVFRKRIIFFFINYFPKGHPQLMGLFRYILYQKKTKTTFQLKQQTGKGLLKKCVAFYSNWITNLNQTVTQHRLLYVMNSTPYQVFLQDVKVWFPLPIPNFDYLESDIRYEIRQINSRFELQAEGRVMAHCVATYHSRCVSGICSIWSFSKYNAENKRKRILTIEVRNNSIVQAKGYSNRNDIGLHDMKVLKRWSKDANLPIQCRNLKVV